MLVCHRYGFQMVTISSVVVFATLTLCSSSPPPSSHFSLSQHLSLCLSCFPCCDLLLPTSSGPMRWSTLGVTTVAATIGHCIFSNKSYSKKWQASISSKNDQQIEKHWFGCREFTTAFAAAATRGEEEEKRDISCKYPPSGKQTGV